MNIELSIDYLKFRNAILYHIVHAEMGDDVDSAVLDEAAKNYDKYVEDIIRGNEVMNKSMAGRIKRIEQKPHMEVSYEADAEQIELEKIINKNKEQIAYFTEESTNLQERFDKILNSKSK